MEYLGYLLFAIVIVITALQLRIFLAARRQQGKPAPELDDILDEEQKRSERLLFYFYSEHCGPCRKVTPMVDKLAATHPNVVKVDVVHQPDVARRFSVMGTPTLIQVDSGQISHVHIGAITEKKLAGMI